MAKVRSIHKGNLEKRVPTDELENYLNNGWEEGFSDLHKQHTSEFCKGKHLGNQNGFKKGQKPWNYGIKAKDSPSLQKALDLAHEASRGKEPWNKGLTKETDERVRKYGESPRTEEWRKNIGEGHKKSGKLKDYLNNRTKEQVKTQVTKSWLTKKKNNTTNNSKPEELLYEKLLKDNETKTIYRNYNEDSRYPFHCDFYIVEDDLFIELNAHWTHGGRPYDPEDQSCQRQLELWEEKAKTSQFYRNAIETWTKRDVEKAKYAKDNNLNYWVIY